MWLLSLLIGYVLANGMMADIQQDLQECVDEAELGNLEELLNSVEYPLEAVCPKIVNLLNCVDNAVTAALGASIADLVSMSPSEQIIKGARMFINIRNMVSDLCTTGTSLNDAYRENAGCLENTNGTDQKKCRDAGKAAFMSFNEAEQVQGNTISTYFQNCIVEAYKVACLGAQFHQACGQSAFELFQTIVKRTTVFPNALCTENQLNTVKTRFLDSLELPEGEKQVYREALDL